MIKKNIRKRGQAALEFLTTYGWAFMVILVMIGALAYFGVLNPDRFLPQRCNIGPEFSCEEFGIFYDDSTPDSGELQVILTNNVGQTITDLRVESIIGMGKDYGLHESCDVMVNGFNISESDVDYLNETSLRESEPIYVLCNNIDVGKFPPRGSKVRSNFVASYDTVGARIGNSMNLHLMANVQRS